MAGARSEELGGSTPSLLRALYGMGGTLYRHVCLKRETSRRMPVELQIIISVSRVRLPPSHRDVAQLVEQVRFTKTLSSGRNKIRGNARGSTSLWNDRRRASHDSLVSRNRHERKDFGECRRNYTSTRTENGFDSLPRVPIAVCSGRAFRHLFCRQTHTPGECRRNYMAPTGQVERVQLPSLPAPRWQTRCPFSAGRASYLFLHPLSPGHQTFGCSSVVERLTVNQDVVGSTPTSRAKNERKISGGMPGGVHRLKRTAERPLTILLSPGPEISRRMPVELHNHLVAGSSPAIAFRDVAQLDRAVENVSPTPCRRDRC